MAFVRDFDPNEEKQETAAQTIAPTLGSGGASSAEDTSAARTAQSTTGQNYSPISKALPMPATGVAPRARVENAPAASFGGSPTWNTPREALPTQDFTADNAAVAQQRQQQEQNFQRNLSQISATAAQPAWGGVQTLQQPAVDFGPYPTSNQPAWGGVQTLPQSNGPFVVGPSSGDWGGSQTRLDPAAVAAETQRVANLQAQQQAAAAAANRDFANDAPNNWQKASGQNWYTVTGSDGKQSLPNIPGSTNPGFDINYQLYLDREAQKPTPYTGGGTYQGYKHGDPIIYNGIFQGNFIDPKYTGGVNTNPDPSQYTTIAPQFGGIQNFATGGPVSIQQQALNRLVK